MKRTVSLGDIKRFGDLVGDFHPLHADRDYAVAAGFEDVIVQGFLVSSFASSLVSMSLPGESTLIVSQSFRYAKPIYPGDDLEIVGTISALDARFMLSTISIAVFVGGVVRCSGSVDVKLRF